ncbi:hypothetical protein CBR_g2960 [Chara braunii]|uniref:ATP-dependent DNA helicase n=1 Tax=Chara braunii TaxID=69332 RepID=A0A388KEI3_CHABU|nr:hypothetical protein CBR_g2960 [Chara braunii]|eukprot:GBG68416.1 hypothetical protein CBR_g2960 [Chara braunii]
MRTSATKEIGRLLEQQDQLDSRRTAIQKCLKVAKKSAAASAQSDSKFGLHSEGQVAPSSASGESNWLRPFQWDEEVEKLRKNLFGLPSFRTHQREIINSVLSGRDVFVIMPSGGGKSLCYQLPAVLRPGVSLVISPLLSLIQDQVMGLKAMGISASMLTQWGHDFRPDYRHLGILKTQFPRVPLVVLTATATERVQADVREMLNMPRCEKFISSVNRPNLFYEVREKKSNANAMMDDIANLIQEIGPGKESGIIYCFSRRECEQIAVELVQRGITAAYYHADMEPEERMRAHTRWISNKVQVIVGTVAFGMGINKPDVRFVIHHTISKSVESYYQESGRAGRDGLPSRCVLFYRCADLPRQSSMVFAEAAGLHNLYSMIRFCQSRRACQRAAIFEHFGENKQDCHGMCDNCADPRPVVDKDVTEHARALLRVVEEINRKDQKVTMLQLVDQWKRQPGDSGRLAPELTKEDTERVVTQLLLSGYLKEEFGHTAYATNAYLALGPLSKAILDGHRFVSLEVFVGGAASRWQDNAAKDRLNLMGSGMTAEQTVVVSKLDDLRQRLAAEHGGIFPHAVLSSQHMNTIATSKPSSLSELEEIIGKTRAEQYGSRIMAALSTSFSKPKEGPVTQSVSAHVDLTRRGEDANDQSVCSSLYVPPKHSTKKSTNNSPSLQSRSAGSQKLKGMKEGANKGISQSRTALPHGPAGVNSLSNAQQNVRKSADKKRRQVDDVNMDVDKVGDTNSVARGEISVSVGVRPSARVGKAVMKNKQSEVGKGLKGVRPEQETREDGNGFLNQSGKTGGSVVGEGLRDQMEKRAAGGTTVADPDGHDPDPGGDDALLSKRRRTAGEG